MKDMEKAIERIDDAIAAGEKILIFGDYDVDGTTAVATVYSFFKERYENLEYYIPIVIRKVTGYQPRVSINAADNGFTLIIALDCGIKSVDKIEYANTPELILYL